MMGFDGFKDRFNKVIESGDDLTAAKELLSDMETEYREAEEALSKVDEQEAKIRDLQDTNMKLYLAQTADPEDEPEEEEKEKTFEELLFEADEEEEED